MAKLTAKLKVVHVGRHGDARVVRTRGGQLRIQESWFGRWCTVANYRPKTERAAVRIANAKPENRFH